MSSNCYYCGGHPDEVVDLRRRRDELEIEVERLRAALKDIQKEAMAFRPPRHTWYYDRAQNALTNSTDPLVRDGLAAPPPS
jgi:hypothetical protein